MAGEVQFGQMTGALMAPVRLQGGDPVMLVSIRELLDDRLLARPNITKGKNSKANALRSRALARPRTCACSICCRAWSHRKGRDIFANRRYPGASLPWSAMPQMRRPFPPDHLAPQLTGMRTLLNMAELNIFTKARD